MARSITLVLILLVSGLVLIAGVLPAIEYFRTNKAQLENHTVNFHLVERSLFDKPFRALARRWLAGGSGTAVSAEAQIRQSIASRPLYAPSWLDLAEIYQRTDRILQAQPLIDVATTLWPTRRRLLWHAAMLAIQSGNYQSALSSLKSYLESKPFEFRRVVAVASRIEKNPESLVTAIVPDQAPENLSPIYYLDVFLRYAVKQKDHLLARASWNRVSNKGQLSDKAVNGYLKMLFDTGRIDELMAVWSDLDRGQPFGAIINGGFELPLSKYYLGWRTDPVKGATISVDDTLSRQGDKSLRIEFDGRENVRFNHLRQNIIVEPGESYSITGFWRGKDITTRQNPHLELRSFDSGQNIAIRTVQRRLSWEWEQFELNFTVPADSNFVVLAMRRNRSAALDNKIAGSVWIDDLKMEKTSRTGG